MPSSKKTVLKDLYKANSVSELNTMAEINTEKNTSLSLLCKSADKVFLKAQDFDLMNDEEMAYIFFMRYFNILTQIKKSHQYKKDKAHFDKLLGETKPRKAIGQAEKLQSSLVKRYEERQKMKEDEELAKKLLAKDSKKQEDNQPKESKKHVKPTSVNDDLDSLLDGPVNGPAISSPSDIYQKLKVNHSSILTPEGSELSNGLHDDTNTLIPHLSRAPPFLTAEQLYSLTKTVPSSDILILDIRPMKEYTNNHIRHDASINIPAEYLEHGVSVSNIDRRIPERTRLIWCQRGTRKHVIILDKCSKVKNISPASKLYQFKEAIFRDDSSCTMRNEPFFLDGGFDDWLWHYPSLASKPELPMISSHSKLNETIDVSTLDFPEIPEEKKTVPTPPPMASQIKPSVNERDISEHNDMYPKVSDVKRMPNGNPGQARNEISRPERKDRSFDLKDGPDSSLPAHPTIPVSQPQIPGHPTVPVSQPQIPGHPSIPVSQPQIPGHPSIPVSQPLIPGHPTIPVSQPQTPGHPTVPTSQPYIVPSSQSQIPASTNPPSFSSGQTVTSGQGGTTPYSLPRGVQGKEYKTISGLPPGWEKCFDKSSNRVFYKDHIMHTTHWNLPIATPEKPQVQNIPKQQLPTPPQPTIPQLSQTQPQLSQTQPQLSQTQPQLSQTQPQLSQTQPQLSQTQPQLSQTKPQLSQTQPQLSQTQPQLSQTQPPQHQPSTSKNLQQPHTKPQPSVPKQKPSQSYQGDKPPSGQAVTFKSGLRRSLSSPNLAKLEDNEPRVDRSSKPVELVQPDIRRPAFNRNAKPRTTLRLESLNPVSGGLGLGLTGLRNLGNTCYMNSVLQCLFSTAPLSAYFISGAFREDLNTKNPMGTRGELAEQFSTLVSVTNTGYYKSISPMDFKKTVGKIKPAFSGYDQQDSQEFLTLMMDKLHEDVNKVTKKPYLPAPEDDVDPRAAAEIAWNNHKKRNESIMLQLFDGLFMSTVRCLTCGKESVTFETFSNLTLPLPTHRSQCSLKNCLELFTRPEKMTGDDKWFCPKCKLHREAVKQLQIWRLPPILIIHLKRFQYDGMWRQKLQTSVSYPLKDLDMSGYVIGPKSLSYNLFSVSNHYGTMHGGHYTAFCINSHDKRWYKFDDQLVSPISNPNNVVTPAGYLLFYTSLSFTPPKPF